MTYLCQEDQKTGTAEGTTAPAYARAGMQPTDNLPQLSRLILLDWMFQLC